jgi:hypothetical protein
MPNKKVETFIPPRIPSDSRVAPQRDRSKPQADRFSGVVKPCTTASGSKPTGGNK